jgi:hypothetical protein
MQEERSVRLADQCWIADVMVGARRTAVDSSGDCHDQSTEFRNGVKAQEAGITPALLFLSNQDP